MSVSIAPYEIPDEVEISTALISVSDKTGIVELATRLAALGIRILSTGGTATALRDAGLEVTDVSDVTGFPEIMDGRVKTLHPGIHGGLLAIRSDEAHRSQMEAQKIGSIDLLVVNLYPFEEAVSKKFAREQIVENVDIGGPAMIRAAAKNHAFVTVLTDPDDYQSVLNSLETTGKKTKIELRQRLAGKAFARTATYDSAIANWFADAEAASIPEHLVVTGRFHLPMRYGENPHQQAGFYRNDEDEPGIASARQIQGKQLSYNNINDTNAAFELVSEFDPKTQPAVAIIKHANPCGVATGPSLIDAYHKALACDPVSAFGGIVALNGTIDEGVAKAIVKTFTEVIIAPDANAAALKIIAAKLNLRLLLTESVADPSRSRKDIRSVSGGYLVQDADNRTISDLDLKVVSKRSPTEQELADLKFAFQVAKHVKSNAIVYVKEGATVGIGAGQMSRVDSSRIAARKAVDSQQQQGLELSPTQGSVVASDAFFPFADGLLSAVEAGASAVIQPGGSMRDEEVIAAADKAGIAMVFTGVRHFRH